MKKKTAFLFVIAFLVLAIPKVFAQERPVYRVVLDPQYHTRLYPEVQSKVIQINKKMGESFQKGETLIVQDHTILEALVAKAEAAVMKGRAEFETKRELYQEKILSYLEFKEAQANLETAHADLEIARKNLESSEIKAPYSGEVVEVFIKEYEVPARNKAMIEIVNDEILIAKLLVPSYLVAAISEGLPFEIRLEETQETVVAKVIRISPVIDPASSTFKIEAEVENRDGKWRAGMTGITHLKGGG